MKYICLPCIPSPIKDLNSNFVVTRKKNANGSGENVSFRSSFTKFQAVLFVCSVVGCALQEETLFLASFFAQNCLSLMNVILNSWNYSACLTEYSKRDKMHFSLCAVNTFLPLDSFLFRSFCSLIFCLHNCVHLSLSHNSILFRIDTKITTY